MDLKEFWDMQICLYNNNIEIKNLLEGIRKRQGRMFWERGGKGFAKEYGSNSLEFMQDLADNMLNRNSYLTSYLKNARDFLDALACLGEEKVKELIKGVGGE